ncbi:T9SS type A sorting domain-containing protein [Chryseobacterium tructae]|uniref:T9SS-dependent choice-of-anchor J family protein n=1 Tax=Chryseobacterium tructae TaxID=1037380 RepID=A0ABV7XW49_9FLAO|nr:T9SS type A sorting domain-containing protein [Chryseobacterium tructae]MDN3692951.1 T9SS type A sorting domain-containing protein [Chryseobacterium tructae]
MVKNLFVLGLLGLSLNLVKAQTVVFQEGFNTGAGWSVIDRDADDENWGIYTGTATTDGWGFTGNFAGSASWLPAPVGALTPDNLLISPAITLPATGTLSLSFQVGSSDTQFFAEHYAAYVLPSTATAFTGTETPLIEGTVTAGRTAIAKTATIPSNLAGQSVKLYFRHFNSNDQNLLILDNVKITQTGSLGTAESKVSKVETSLYPNPATDVLNIKSKGKVNAVEIYDVSGRKVSADLDGDKVNVKNLNPGSYIISIETKEGKTTEKFIKK